MSGTYEENISARLDSDHNPHERAENATMLAIGSIADSLVKIADRLYEIGGLLEDWKDKSTERK